LTDGQETKQGTRELPLKDRVKRWRTMIIIVDIYL